jgi:Tol biopolymer transport system component
MRGQAKERMAKTKHFGALAAAVGAIVAACLLVLVLVVVKPQPGRAALPGTNGLIAYEGIDPIDGDLEIFAIHPDLGGSQGRQLTFNNTSDSNPCYSPDGNTIAYLGRTANNDYQIFTMPATGGQRVQVTPNTANPLECSFTGPRGSHIVYSGYDGSDYEIFTIPANGGTPRQVTFNNGRDSDPSFTAVGQQIAYSGDSSGPYWGEIFTIPVNGGTPRQVTFSTHTADIDPDYRPDGQMIVYSHLERGSHNNPLDYEIQTTPATGGPGGQRLTSNSSNIDDLDPVYSPNGQQIAYSRTGGVGDSSDYEIFTMPATGGTPVQVTFNNTDDRSPSWQPRVGINKIRQLVEPPAGGGDRSSVEGRGTGGAETR